MKVIALTGGFATGKSTVARQLRRLGAPVFDMDVAGHRVLHDNKRIIEKVARRFPAAVKNGNIDRKILGDIVFKNSKDLHWLENLVHPEIFKEQDRFIRRQKAGGKHIIVIEIPLLFEIRAESKYDLVLLVTAPIFQQKRRAMARPSMTEKKLKDILARQLPQHVKRKKADREIFTGLGFGDTMRQTRKFWHELTHAA